MEGGGTTSFKLEAKRTKRAVTRGLGPAKQGEVFLVSHFLGGDIADPRLSVGQAMAATIAPWWMLREIELPSVKC